MHTMKRFFLSVGLFVMLSCSLFTANTYAASYRSTAFEEYIERLVQERILENRVYETEYTALSAELAQYRNYSYEISPSPIRLS